MQTRFRCLDEWINDWKKKDGTQDKVLTLQDMSTGPRLKHSVHYALAADEQHLFGTLRDKDFDVVVTEIRPIGGAVRLNGKLVLPQ